MVRRNHGHSLLLMISTIMRKHPQLDHAPTPIIFIILSIDTSQLILNPPRGGNNHNYASYCMFSCLIMIADEHLIIEQLFEIHRK